MVFTCWDKQLNQKVDIDKLPYKQNNIYDYKKWRREGRYACLECGTIISLVDEYTNTSKYGKEYFVKSHFRCNNKDCTNKKELQHKKRANSIGKKGESKQELYQRHRNYVDNWLKHFDIDYNYLDEGLIIHHSKTIVIFSYLLITFEIIMQITRDYPNYKVIVILDEDAKCRTITCDPTYHETETKSYYSIYLPKKNDIQYCLEKNFQVYLDTGEDILIQLFDNNSTNCCFNAKLVLINDLSFKTGIFKHQHKPIYRNAYTCMHLFEDAQIKYKKEKEIERKIAIKDNERKEFIRRRQLFKMFKKYNL